MNNKLFKLAVVLVTIVVVLCSFAFAAEITELSCSEAKDQISMTVTFADDATRGAYIAYAAKKVEAGTDGAEVIGADSFELGNIVAIFQADTEQYLELGNHAEPINPELISEGYDHIVLKAGDNGAESLTAAAFAAEIPVSVAEYTITFVDYDGEKLYEVKVTEGETPVYGGETPVREADEENTYAFIGWTPDIVAATENATYTATYEATPIVPDVDTFTVTFVSEGAEYAKVEEVAAGTALSTLVPAEPTKAKSGSKRYAFIGWYLDDAFTTKMAENTVAVDTTLYAKFSQIGVYGDANANGAIAVNDIAQIKKYLASPSAYTGKANSPIEDCQTSGGKTGLYGDANGNGAIAVNDIAQIKKYLASPSTYTGKAGTDMVMIKD